MNADKLAGPGLLLVISLLFHWKLVLTNQYTWLEAGDIGSLILPWFQFQAGEWHHWRFPMWDPYSWTGQPLFGQAQPGAAYPINWLLFSMPLKHGWMRQDVLHWWYVLVHYLAGLSAYALCRDLGRSRLASVLGGIGFSLAGYVAYTDSPQMLHGAVWAPLVFLFLFRVERGEQNRYRQQISEPPPSRDGVIAPGVRQGIRLPTNSQGRVASAVLSGFFLGVTWLAGHHQMQIFLSLAVAGMWVWIVASSQKPVARMVWLAVVAFLMTGVTSAFQTLPEAEFGRLAVRWVGADEPQGLAETVPYLVHAQYALKPISLIGIFVAGMEHGAFNAFVGIAAFALAILGAILWWHERYVRWLAPLALCGILFALGGNSVFHGMFYALAPLVEKARVPAAATVLFAVGTAVLAAFGLDAIREDVDRRAGREPAPLNGKTEEGRSGTYPTARHISWVLAGVVAVLAFGSLAFYAARVPIAISGDRLVITSLCAFLAAGLFAARF